MLSPRSRFRRRLPLAPRGLVRSPSDREAEFDRRKNFGNRGFWDTCLGLQETLRLRHRNHSRCLRVSGGYIFRFDKSAVPEAAPTELPTMGQVIDAGTVRSA